MPSAYHEAPERAEEACQERVKSFAKQTGATSGRLRLQGRRLKKSLAPQTSGSELSARIGEGLP
jgi:hypothetical protein